MANCASCVPRSCRPSIRRWRNGFVLGGAGIGLRLPRRLIGSDAGWLVDFCAGVVEFDVAGQVAADRLAGLVEQRNGAALGRKEQVVRLHEHGGEAEAFARLGGDGEGLAGHEHLSGGQILTGLGLVEQRLKIAILGQQ